MLFLAGLFSCEDDTIDFRSKYIGEWAFDIEKTDLSEGLSKNKRTIHESKVGYIKTGSSKGELILEYGANEIITFEVDQYGKLVRLPNSLCSGSVNGDSQIELYLRWGQGNNGFIHQLRGEKINSSASL
jgi:hypothetical protein